MEDVIVNRNVTIKKMACVVLIVIAMVSILNNFNYEFYFYFVPSLVLVESAYMIFYMRHSKCLQFMFFCLFYFNYSIVFGLYFNRLAVYNHLYNMLPVRTWELSISYLLLFFSSVCFFLKKPKVNLEIASTKENNFIYFISLTYVFVIGIVSIFFENHVFDKMREYSICFITLGLLSTKKRKNIYQMIVGVLILVFASLRRYGRVDAIEYLMIPLLLYIIPKLKSKTIVLGSLFGIIGFTFLGLIGDYYGSQYITLEDLLSALSIRKFTNDTSVFAYYTGACFIDDIKIYSLSERLKYFAGFNVWNLIGGEGASLFGLSEEFYSLDYLSSLNHLHWSGGTIFSYLAFYLGSFGVFGGAFLTSYILNRCAIVKKRESLYTKTLAICMIATVFRWYLYSPFVRNLILISFIYLFLILVQNSFLQKCNIKNQSSFQRQF